MALLFGFSRKRKTPDSDKWSRLNLCIMEVILDFFHLFHLLGLIWYDRPEIFSLVAPHYPLVFAMCIAVPIFVGITSKLLTFPVWFFDPFSPPQPPPFAPFLSRISTLFAFLLMHLRSLKAVSCSNTESFMDRELHFQFEQREKSAKIWGKGKEKKGGRRNREKASNCIVGLQCHRYGFSFFFRSSIWDDLMPSQHKMNFLAVSKYHFLHFWRKVRFVLFSLSSLSPSSSVAEEENPVLEWKPLQTGCSTCLRKSLEKKGKARPSNLPLGNQRIHIFNVNFLFVRTAFDWDYTFFCSDKFSFTSITPVDWDCS